MFEAEFLLLPLVFLPLSEGFRVLPSTFVGDPQVPKTVEELVALFNKGTKSLASIYFDAPAQLHYPKNPSMGVSLGTCFLFILLVFSIKRYTSSSSSPSSIFTGVHGFCVLAIVFSHWFKYALPSWEFLGGITTIHSDLNKFTSIQLFVSGYLSGMNKIEAGGFNTRRVARRLLSLLPMYYFLTFFYLAVLRPVQPMTKWQCAAEIVMLFTLGLEAKAKPDEQLAPSELCFKNMSPGFWAMPIAFFSALGSSALGGMQTKYLFIVALISPVIRLHSFGDHLWSSSIAHSPNALQGSGRLFLGCDNLWGRMDDILWGLMFSRLHKKRLPGRSTLLVLAAFLWSTAFVLVAFSRLHGMGTKEVVWAAVITPLFLQLGTGVLCLAISGGARPFIFDNAVSHTIGTLRWPVFLLHNAARAAFVTPLQEVESVGGVRDIILLSCSMIFAMATLMTVSYFLQRLFDWIFLKRK